MAGGAVDQPLPSDLSSGASAGRQRACCDHKAGPGYASPLEAMKGPREELIYVTCVYNGTHIR